MGKAKIKEKVILPINLKKVGEKNIDNKKINIFEKKNG